MAAATPQKTAIDVLLEHNILSQEDLARVERLSSAGAVPQRRLAEALARAIRVYFARQAGA